MVCSGEMVKDVHKKARLMWFGRENVKKTTGSSNYACGILWLCVPNILKPFPTRSNVHDQ